MSANEPLFDSPWEALADAGFDITGMVRLPGGWIIRVASALEAEHDTYTRATADTPEEAARLCLDWWSHSDDD